MSEISKLFDLASLAEASYVHFDKLTGTVEEALQDADLKGTFSATQAADFVDNWAVVSHQKNTENGFSATLFRNIISGEFVYATRGTEPGDPWNDIAGADGGDMVIDGLAIKQIVDMYNDWQRLNAAENTAYRMATLDFLATETALLSAAEAITPFGVPSAYKIWLRSRSDIVIDEPLGRVYTISTDNWSDEVYDVGDTRRFGADAISAGAQLTITGHSLGGHLAAAFTRLFPESGAEAVTINGAGFMTGLVGGLSGNAATNIANLFAMLGGAADFNSSKILNLYGEKGLETTTMDSIVGLEQQGGHQGIFIEDIWNNTLGHGKEQMTDALAVYDLFTRLDSQLKTAAVADLLTTLNPIFEAATGAENRPATFESLINIFGSLYVDDYIPIENAQSQSEQGREDFYAAIDSIRGAIEGKSATIVSLAEKSPAEIESMAFAPAAVDIRYALVNLNPFAIIGADYSEFNKSGELELYDPNTGKGQLSNMYLADRAEMLAHLIYANLQDTTITGSEAQYIDLGQGIHLNKLIGSKRIVFGSNNGEVLEGTHSLFGIDNVGDRLYGMGGNDTLKGYGGEDYLEGGRGYDELYGGDDKDTFAVFGEDSACDLFNGGEGEDRIIGGAGDDTIRMHDFSGENTVEIIDGREGVNIVAGTALDDKLDFSGTVLENIDHIDGGGGHDRIIGSAGNDHIEGGADHDDIEGGLGDDTLYGNEGIDTLYGGKDNDTLYGASTETDDDGICDILDGGAGQDVYYAGEGDLIRDEDHTGTIYFQGHNIADLEYERLFEGVYKVRYSDGTDTGMIAAYDKEAKKLIGNVGFVSIDDFQNGAYGVCLPEVSEDAEYYIAGNWLLNDWFENESGTDFLSVEVNYPGCDYENNLDGSWDRAVDSCALYGLDGDDHLNGSKLTEYLNGGDGDDWIACNDGDDIVDAGAGDDYVTTLLGNSSVFGGSGDDLVVGNWLEYYHTIYWGPQTFYGEYEYEATIHSSQSAAQILDGFEPTVESTLAEDDGLLKITWNTFALQSWQGSAIWDLQYDISIYEPYINSEDRDHFIEHGFSLYGDYLKYPGLEEMAFDIRYIHPSSAPEKGSINEDYTAWVRTQSGYVHGSDEIGWGVPPYYYLKGYVKHENSLRIYGGSGEDTLVGNEGKDFISGGLDSDFLYGNGGDDTILGGQGNDFIAGGLGDDFIEAGFGADTIYGETGSDDLWGGAGDDVIYGDCINGKNESDSGNDCLIGGDGADQLYGQAGDDQLWGDAGDDYLAGGDGADLLYGGGGNDILDGGTGNDELDSGGGNDVFLFGRGYGRDTIYIWDAEMAFNNMIRFHSDVGPSDILVAKTDDGTGNLTLSIKDTDDVLTIFHFFDSIASPYSQIDAVEFSDGTIWNIDLLTEKAFGANEPGLQIQGTVGDDTLNGRTGNDTLEGGVGADVLSGGAGDDTYIYNLGDGIDTIDDIALPNQGNVLVFGEGITANSLSLGLGSLLIRTCIEGDEIHLNNFNSEDAYGEHSIETFRFFDGTTLSYEQLIDKGFDLTGTAANDIIDGTNVVDRITAFGGDDIICSGSGNDIITAGAGDDFVNSGAGDDQILFGLEDGQDIIYDAGGTDVLVLGDGITIDDAWIVREGNDVLVTLVDGSQTLVRDWALSENRIENIRFGDGTEQSLESALVLRARSYELSMMEDTSLSGTIELGNAGEGVVFEVMPGSHGALNVQTDGTWTYQPVANFNGQDLVEVRVTNSVGELATSVLDFNITPVNDAPAVSGTAALGELAEDNRRIITAEQLLANASDVDGDNLSVTGLSADIGNLTDNGAGNWTYQPAADFNGPVDFSYNVTDGDLTVAAVAALTVTPINDVPVVPASEQHQLLGTLTQVGILSVFDVDGDPLSFEVSILPQHGALTINEDGRWGYAAEDGYCGSDQAVITVDDGNGGTASTILDFSVNVYSGGNLVIDGDGPAGLRLDGVSKDDLQLDRQEDDLHIDVCDRGTIFLKGYFTAPENGIEWLDTTDGPLHLAKDVITEGIHDGCVWSWWRDNRTHGSEGKDLVYGSSSSDILYGRGQNDVLFGGDGADILKGDSGDDSLIGGNGLDLLAGGAGHDTLYGGDGIDTLLGGAGNDCLVGGAGSDLLWGNDGNDRMYGDGGNDMLSGGKAADLLAGGQGNDYLYGNDGGDTLIGGAGDDVLSGGDGSDLYLFETGAGYDQIVEAHNGFCWWSINANDEDVIRFGERVNKEDVAFLSRWGSLQVGYGDADQVDVLPNGFSQSCIERIELADGSYLTDADINQLIQQMAAFAVDEGIAMNSINDVRNNQELMTMVVNSWHSA